jgi:hypothetical protein
MTGSAELERGYRRWLWCYPRWFRQEHEAEMLDLLISAARDGQRRPDRAECLTLVRGAAILWLRPRIPMTQRIASSAVRLMYLVAVADLGVALVVAGTAGDLRSAIAARDAGYTASQWHAEVTGALDPMMARLVVAAGITVVLAWATGRRRSWAKVAFAVGFAVTVYSVVAGVRNGSAIYAPVDLAAAGVLCVLQSAVLVQLVRARR